MKKSKLSGLADSLSLAGRGGGRRRSISSGAVGSRDKKVKVGYALFLLAIIFISVFAIRAATFKLSGEDYFSLKYIKHIRETGSPFFYDSLSYGGRPVEEPFLFYYIMAGFSFFSTTAVTLLPALFMSCLIFLIYSLSLRFAGKRIALIAALLAGFVPVSFSVGLSSYSLALPIIFLLAYLFFRIEERKYLNSFIIFSFILPLTSSLSIFFFVSILVYFLLVGLERKKLSGLEKEALLFSLFVNLFVSILIFRKALATYGFSIVWQNTPASVLVAYFHEFSFLQAFYLVGAILLLLGMVGFVASFREKKLLLLSSFVITSLAFLWLRILPFKVGLILLAFSLASLSALGLRNLIFYLRKTKFSSYRGYVGYVVLAVVVLIVLSGIIPSVLTISRTSATVTPHLKEGLEFLGEIGGGNLESITLLAPFEYGHAIAAYGLKNVADSLFLLAPDTEQRVRDIKTVYVSRSENLVFDLLHKYNVDYVLVDEMVENEFGKFGYVDNKKCFKKVFEEDETRIYKVRC